MRGGVSRPAERGPVGAGPGGRLVLLSRGVGRLLLVAVVVVVVVGIGIILAIRRIFVIGNSSSS